MLWLHGGVRAQEGRRCRRRPRPRRSIPTTFFRPWSAASARPAAQERHKAGWLWLQAGDLKAAERNFEAALKLSGDFYPSEAGLGYVGLAKKDLDEAATHFDCAVVANPRYIPALVGRGEALLGLGERDMALKSLEAAVVADPSLGPCAPASRCFASEGSRTMWLMRGRRPRRGKFEDARRLYDRAIAASPESPFLYREVADVARRQGDLDTALRQAQKAAELEPTDARAQILIGEIYEAQKDAAKAIAAYEAALPLEPNEALERKIETLREGLALAAMPTEFQSIESSSDALARTAGGARRRAAGWSLQARAAPERGRDDRHARQLGRALDPVGHAGGGDGGLSQPHLPARGRGPPRRIWRRPPAACCRSSRPRSPRWHPRGGAPAGSSRTCRRRT